MFGIIRFILAWVVVIAHIAQTYKYASAFAVYAFFILSGFLMTLIMNERYGYNISGFIKYIINRALRIYPLYWLLSLVSLIFIVFVSAEFAESMHPALRLPESVHEIVSNFFILGLYPESIFSMARLSPQAWALHIELVFYFLIGIGLGRRIEIVLVWFSISLLYHVYANIYSLPRYSPIFAASIAFSMGSLLYHIRPYLKQYIDYSNQKLIAVTLVYFVFVYSAGDFEFGESMIFFYLNMILFSVFLYILSLITNKNAQLIKVDKFFGDLSYPVYLCHWIVAVIVSYLINTDSLLQLLLYCVPVIFVFSYLISKFIDHPIELVRRIIRN